MTVVCAPAFPKDKLQALVKGEGRGGEVRRGEVDRRPEPDGRMMSYGRMAEWLYIVEERIKVWSCWIRTVRY